MRHILLALSFCLLCYFPSMGQEGHDHGAGETLHGQFDRSDDHSHDYDFSRPYATHHRGVEDAHGHAGHTSAEGYPFVHGIRTEIDFIERALEFGLGWSKGADDGMVDELEFETELVWALNDRMILIMGAPLISLDPRFEPNTTGMGDIEFGVQFLAFDGERDLLFFALNATFPTGDEQRDLGAGHTTLEPTALWLHDFGRGTFFQSRFGWEVPLSTTNPDTEFKYDLGLYHCLTCTEHWRAFRFLTPGIEINGTTRLNGPEQGDTVLDLTTGVRWLVREMDEVGFGWSFPISGAQDFDYQILFSYRLHF